MGHLEWLNQQVDNDFQRARLLALLHGAVRLLRQEPRTLLPFEEVRARLNVRGQHELGIQTVALEQIVGSEGRYADFDRQFLPRHEATKERWKNVDRAHYQDVMLPPIELYKLGDAYFVRDGNHRVSVARQQGQTYIDAHVIELVSDVRLKPTLTHEDLTLLEERSDFLEWTNLAQLRPDQNIEISQPGGYLDMIRHINGHRYFKSLELGYDLTAEEALLSWYDTIYLPLIEAIERTGVLAAFPGRSAADLYLWIMDHRYYLTLAGGFDPGAEQAALDYTRQFGERKLKRSLPPPPSSEEQEFLKWSQLGRLRPSIRLPLSEGRDYGRLRQHLLDHQFYLGNNLQREVPFEEAAASWHDCVYEPVARAIAEQHALDLFPKCTAADLYLLVTDHLHYRKGQGVEIDATTATRDYARTFGRERASLLTGVLHRARRLMRLSIIGS
ncbi:MAG TPA: hypothetical protein VGE07_16430 [Herpetosiphonaceae bacterium]